MRALLRRLGTRTGISLVLLLLVGGVVVIGRTIGGPASKPGANRPAQTALPTSTEGDDGPVAVSPSAFSDDATVREAATVFIDAWLQRSRSAEVWHAALVPLSTASLAESLVGVDPSGVPASRVVRAAALTLRTEAYAEATITVDTGTVLLGLLKQRDRWLVDTVDWQAV